MMNALSLMFLNIYTEEILLQQIFLALLEKKIPMVMWTK